jgi:processive 1,2-diacylglycerol beta-glucosyltransferase
MPERGVRRRQSRHQTPREEPRLDRPQSGPGPGVREGRGKRVLILTASAGSGHNAAAAVLDHHARAAPEVEEVQTLDVLELTGDLYRRLYDDAYFRLVNAMPWVVGWSYDSRDAPFSHRDPLWLWDQLNTTEVARAIQSYEPDIVISTHFLPARVVSLLRSRTQIHSTTSVVTTDYDFQGLWLSVPFNRFFVARDETKAHMVEIGLPADRITVSGIPVRAIFGEPVDPAAVLARYQLRRDVPTLLISAGAAGGQYAHAVVAQTLRMRNSFQAVVVCGRNEQLKADMTALVADGAERYRVLGYTTDMPDLMRASTLFVGKPGGLSSSECMAAGLPMVLVNPIPGQEVRNSYFLLEEGAAVHCNYQTTVGYKIDSLLDDPERLRRMAANAGRLGKRDAGSLVVATALNEPSASLWISRDAQRVIRRASQEGLSARGADVDPHSRVMTVVDAETGCSVALVTPGDLDTYAKYLPAQGPVRVTSALLQELTRRHAAPDLVLLVQHVLGDADGVTLVLQD